MDIIQLNIFGGKPKIVIHAKQGEKMCTDCGEVKNLDCFSGRKVAKDGASYICKDCASWDKLMRRYGLTKTDYYKLLEMQNFSCAICGSDGSTGHGGKLYVDHDHKTGHVRGLLCPSCNVSIGNLGDNIPGLRRAKRYLRRHKFAKQ